MQENLSIRPAKSTDITAIIDLLSLALGESSSRKTKPYWRWKHIDNPFGPSVVWLAEQNGEVVGLRAFMRWDWRYKNQEFKALRAVDTATHPEYRRQGIFTTLTLRAVEQSLEQGYDFIFNTPNAKSRPGYLNMGWEKWSRMPLYLHVHRPLSGLLRFLGIRDIPANEWGPEHVLREPVIRSWFESHQKVEPKFCRTPVNAEYLLWRYAHCPVADYGCSVRDGSLLVFRLRESRYGRELRICDWFWTEETKVKQLLDQMKEVAGKYGATVSTHPSYGGEMGTGLRKGLRSWNVTNFSPLITMRPLNRSLDDLPSVSNWQLTTGTMELF